VTAELTETLVIHRKKERYMYSMFLGVYKTIEPFE